MVDPIAEFQELFARARRLESGDPTSMALATATPDGRPAVRMVLLKAADERGFVFYTNFGSRKSRELADNPRAALCVYWISLEQQVRIEGPVERVADDEADAYFASRSRGSQLGAWASRQSAPLSSRFHLLRNYLRAKIRFAGREIPRPEFWGGYRVRPECIEFWSGQKHRLHDRRRYTSRHGSWIEERLYP